MLVELARLLTIFIVAVGHFYMTTQPGALSNSLSGVELQLANAEAKSIVNSSVRGVCLSVLVVPVSGRVPLKIKPRIFNSC